MAACDMIKKDYVDGVAMFKKIRLFTGKNPYKEKQDDFLAVLRCNVRFQAENCPEYARLIEARGFCPDDLKTAEDAHRIPPLPTLFFKRNTLLSVPERKLMLRATSSGTSGGSVSRIGFDRGSFLTGVMMAARMFAYHGVISLVPAHYIMLGYEPKKGFDLGAAKSAHGATFFAPALSRTYALRATGDGHEPNPEGVKETLLRCVKKGAPVRFVGFPAYLIFLLQELERENVTLPLNRRSKILLGGGWKQFSGAAVSPEQLRTMAQTRLGIPPENILEFFSAAEHPIAYCKCKNGHFHLPGYCRVVIRDANTLKPLPKGRAGLLNFITPLVDSMPLVSVMTDDIAVLHDGADCGCGIETPYFTLHGRAGARGIKTCSATAAELAGGRRGA